MEQTQEVIQEKSAIETPTGTVVKQKTSVSSNPGGLFQTQYMVYYVLGVIEVLLAFRLILKMLGAASGSGFVSLIYGITDLLVAPFVGIFSPAVTKGAETQAVFEPSTVIAMLVYAVIAWGITKLLGVSSGDHTNS